MRSLLVTASAVLLLLGCTDAAGTPDGGSKKGDGGPGDGAVLSEPCTPATAKSCVDDVTAVVCNAEGTGYVGGVCPSFTYCDGTSCVPQLCVPDALGCKDLNTIGVCDGRGTAYTTKSSCNAVRGESCLAGACITECDLARRNASYIGCEYFAVHLDNVDATGSTPAASAQPMTLVASNGASLATTFTVYQPNGAVLASCKDVPVPAKGIGKCDVKDLTRNSGVSAKAYRLVSERPVTVYQFNPLNNVNVYSNDASLLLPSHVAAQQYYAMSWAQIAAASPPGQVVVVAVTDGATSLKFTSTAPTTAGTGFAAMTAGELRTVTLNKGDVFSVETNAADADLTGSFIDADKPVQVFGAHRCANVPSGAGYANYCDHLEEQLFPVATWGKGFVSARTADRPNSGTDVPDFFRVIASAEGTTLTTNPVVPGFPMTLGKGKFATFSSAQDFELTASAPVSIAQFLPGSTYQNPNAATVHVGDPSMMLVPPSEQFRTSYVVLTPSSYTANFINVVQPAGAEATIDDAPVLPTSCKPVGSGAFQACRVAVGEGTHRIAAKRAVGVILYGYASDVSYGYVGGLDLKKIAGGWK